MARVEITAQDIDIEGVTVTVEAVNASKQHKFTNTGREFLFIRNSNASTRTVTLNIPLLVDGQAVNAPVVTIPGFVNGADPALDVYGEIEIGPFPKGIYNQADGMVYVDFSSEVGVEVAVKRLPAANA